MQDNIFGGNIAHDTTHTHQLRNLKCVLWPINYSHTCDIIYTNFYGITDKWSVILEDCFAPSFLSDHPYFYPAIPCFYLHKAVLMDLM